MSEQAVASETQGTKGFWAKLNNLAQAMEVTEGDAMWSQIQKLSNQLDAIEARLANLEGR